jgi:replicative DNA helicase
MERTLPQNKDAEKSTLGSILLDNKAFIDIAEILDPDDYYNPLHSEIFSAMKELNREKEPIDTVTLSSKLKNTHEIDMYLLELIDFTPTAANAIHYAKIVEGKSRLRKQITGCREAARLAFEGEDPDTVVVEIEKTISSSSNKSISSIYTFGEVMQSYLKQLENRCGAVGQIPGVPTGWLDLDIKLGGLQRGSFYLIGARPSMGKTAFSLNIADFIGIEQNLPVALFSLEMTKEQLMNREFSSRGLIDANKLKLGTLDEGDWQEVASMLNYIASAPIVVDDTPRNRVIDILAKARRIKNKYGELGAIIIDYLQLITPSSKTGNREQEVAEISRSLKIMAKELNCPVVCLSQLSRQCEQRDDKRPRLSDLRESGSIEQDADVVIFLYRDDYYNPESEKKNIAEVIVAKGRNEGTGTIELAWLGQYQKFANLEKYRGESNESNNNES